MLPSEFESVLKKILYEMRGVRFERRRVKVGDSEKEFDFVSIDGKYIGDAKYYKNTPTGVPSAKLSTISEYVWLLQKTDFEHKFLIFGNDKKVPKMFLKRWGSLAKDVEFYFFDGKTLERLN